MKLISVVTPCYNEELNIAEVYQQVKAVFKRFPEYRYEHIFIDNASTDSTAMVLRELAKKDHNVKVILNARNFGDMRSSYHALLQARGDAVICIVADLQEPPKMIEKFIEKWQAGYKIVAGVKPKTEVKGLSVLFRKLYYRALSKISDVKLINDFTGFGLYDKEVIEHLKKIDDRYPYLRGLVSELGLKITEVPYQQAKRLHGKSNIRFYALYNWFMLGVTSHSKLPIRLMTMVGFLFALISFGLSLVFLVLKLIFWSQFNLGVAPLLIGLFFFFSIQLFFMGLLGEYIAAIHTRIMNRPLVVEEERINFD